MPVTLARRRIGLGAGHRRRARRDDDGGGLVGLPGLDRLIDGLAVVSTVRRDARDLALDLAEQARHLTSVIGLVAGQDAGGDLARIGVQREVELPPGAARPAVPSLLPLALPEQLQPGAVDQQVQGPMRHDPWPKSSEAAAAPAQGGMVRHAELEPEQAERAADEALGLAQGEPEDQPEHQHQLDRQVRIAGLAARRRPPCRLPAPPRPARASSHLGAEVWHRTAANSEPDILPLGCGGGG